MQCTGCTSRRRNICKAMGTMQSFEVVVHCAMDVVQYAKQWVWTVTWKLCCRMRCHGCATWPSKYSTGCNAMV